MKYETNKNPKGKLYAKFYNSMRFLKSSGLVTSSVKNVEKPNSRKHTIHFGKIFSTHYLVPTYDVFLLITFVICIRTRKRHQLLSGSN